jgi:diadenosine tetraphosphatase ApaH/serine/threonine PP2A family protein phosphatase
VKYGIVSDIHANWHALEAVLGDMPEVEDVLCLGDVVGYGGLPGECLEEVRSRGWLTLVGNHDRACTQPDILEWFNEDAGTVIRWTIDKLAKKQLYWLQNLPDESRIFGALLVHASPRDHIYEYILDGLTAYANLKLLDDAICFHGHSHVPGIFTLDQGSVKHSYEIKVHDLEGPCLVNPGSVGQPRDGNPDASYGIWDTEAHSFEFRRVAYDRMAAQKAILDAGLPARFAARLDMGR